MTENYLAQRLPPHPLGAALGCFFWVALGLLSWWLVAFVLFQGDSAHYPWLHYQDALFQSRLVLDDSQSPIRASPPLFLPLLEVGIWLLGTSFPMLFFWLGAIALIRASHYFRQAHQRSASQYFTTTLLAFLLCLLSYAGFAQWNDLPLSNSLAFLNIAGGFIGNEVASLLQWTIGDVATAMVLYAGMIVGTLWLFNTSIFRACELLGWWVDHLFDAYFRQKIEANDRSLGEIVAKMREQTVSLDKLAVADKSLKIVRPIARNKAAKSLSRTQILFNDANSLPTHEKPAPSAISSLPTSSFSRSINPHQSDIASKNQLAIPDPLSGKTTEVVRSVRQFTGSSDVPRAFRVISRPSDPRPSSPQPTTYQGATSGEIGQEVAHNTQAKNLPLTEVNSPIAIERSVVFRATYSANRPNESLLEDGLALAKLAAAMSTPDHLATHDQGKAIYSDDPFEKTQVIESGFAEYLPTPLADTAVPADSAQPLASFLSEPPPAPSTINSTITEPLPDPSPQVPHAPTSSQKNQPPKDLTAFSGTPQASFSLTSYITPTPTNFNQQSLGVDTFNKEADEDAVPNDGGQRSNENVKSAGAALKTTTHNVFQSWSHFPLPPIHLLDTTPAEGEPPNDEVIRMVSQQIESALKSFGVSVEVKAAYPGPVITRYEVQLASGVKGAQIVNLSKDLARTLAVMSIRVVENIPGKPWMGLEVPNERRQMVKLSEIIGSAEFQKDTSPLPLAIGKDISGVPKTLNLVKMPHLLVAGTTGSGKSVGLNDMILSMLYKSTPNEVRILMIDPKMVELSVYNDIPHLIAPVITDMKQAVGALNWCVNEMERREQLLSKLAVRSIDKFNKKVRDARISGNPIADPLEKERLENIGAQDFSSVPTLTPLPYLVVIVDEFADLFMVIGKKIEEVIARLAQKGRAGGIHLILATQRPSVDVVTGLIKANVPSRIAFQVSSKIDSRTILDNQGAEALLGQGDMLYYRPGEVIQRMHGAFVSDDEVNAVADYLRDVAEPKYLVRTFEDPTEEGNSKVGTALTNGQNEYDMAVQTIMESTNPSISYLQRRMEIGFNKAAKYIEQMENDGIISPPQKNGKRTVLIRGDRSP